MVSLPSLHDPKELADLLGTTPSDVLNMARRNLIPSIRVGGKFYFSAAKVVEAIRAHQAEPPALAVR